MTLAAIGHFLWEGKLQQYVTEQTPNGPQSATGSCNAFAPGHRTIYLRKALVIEARGCYT